MEIRKRTQVTERASEMINMLEKRRALEGSSLKEDSLIPVLEPLSFSLVWVSLRGVLHNETSYTLRGHTAHPVRHTRSSSRYPCSPAPHRTYQTVLKQLPLIPAQTHLAFGLLPYMPLNNFFSFLKLSVSDADNNSLQEKTKTIFSADNELTILCRSALEEHT